jgi:D-alanine-D-alanine ligase
MRSDKDMNFPRLPSSDSKPIAMRLNIAVVAGGDSGEYEVSVKSAAVVASHLDPARFEPFVVVIRGNDWYFRDADGAAWPVSRDDFSLLLPGRKVKFDGVFVAIHGTPGEDGKLQGYFDLLGIPYTSCDQASSALTFNKFFCNHFVKSFGVKISGSMVVFKDDVRDESAILSAIPLPFFVKPNRGGSSVGASKVKTADELAPALDKAFREDSQVMIEAFIPGREIACGVIRHRGNLITLPITEIISQNEFFDYEAKYLGKSSEVTPAQIPDAIEEECRSVSLKLYRLLNCRGIVRFDYIINGNGLNFLEVNTIPGFSEQSIIPQQAAVAGIGLRELFSEAMQDALDRR